MRRGCGRDSAGVGHALHQPQAQGAEQEGEANGQEGQGDQEVRQMHGIGPQQEGCQQSEEGQ